VPPMEPGRNGAADDAADDEMDAILGLPPPKTPLERLRDVRIVRSALSQRMLTRLRSAGIIADTPAGQQSNAAELELSSAHHKASSAMLGLDAAAVEQVAKLPMPPAANLQISASTVGLSHDGLWDRFRKVCGMALPSSTPAATAACELRNSRGGGQVLLPVASATEA